MQSFRDAAFSNEEGEDNSSASIKKRHRREVEEAERENRENTSALLELRDLEDELSSLSRLFEHQDVTIRSMKTIYERPELQELTKNGRGFLNDALGRLEDYKAQIAEMMRRVETTRNDVSFKPSKYMKNCISFVCVFPI
jgi:hypothetical protein